jgi:hypothetical protein
VAQVWRHCAREACHLTQVESFRHRAIKKCHSKDIFLSSRKPQDEQNKQLDVQVRGKLKRDRKTQSLGLKRMCRPPPALFPFPQTGIKA